MTFEQEIEAVEVENHPVGVRLTEVVPTKIVTVLS
jgi:hypothetical protein